MFAYMGGIAEVTINWSNEQWVDRFDRPPNPDEEWAIERLDGLASGVDWPVAPMGFGTFDSGWFRLPIDYNPEWVSVDIRGITGDMEITDGVIEHVCLVPEPGSMALIGICLLALIKRNI